MELLEDDIIRYRLEKSSPKKTEEFVYEFNYKDINAKLLAVEIKGNKIFVNFVTNAKAKLINYYVNAEVKPYVYTFKVQFKDYEIARNFAQAMREVIEE
jgi:transcription initiation factor IIE alpha subunit